MSKKDTKSIKYVLNEMDPAEEVEFEREMEYDPDLLIEVESIKRMQKRLEQLPHLSPPEALSESLLSLAAEESTKEGNNNLRFFLTAAVLLFGLTTGSLFFENPFESDGSNYQASINLYSPTVAVESNQHSGKENLSPWIDRNNILKLNSLDTGNYNTRPWEVNDNHSKLRPSNHSLYQNTVTRSLHLTGSKP